MTRDELEITINVVVCVVRDYGGFAEYVLRDELAKLGVVLNSEEIIVAMEAALVRVESVADNGAVAEKNLLTMPVQGSA